jgi:signal peptidase I
MSRKKEVRIIAGISVMIGLAIVGLFGCGKKSYTIPNTSMEPTIKSGSHVFVDTTFYDKSPILFAVK